jgi:hypothetical protein
MCTESFDQSHPQLKGRNADQALAMVIRFQNKIDALQTDCTV